MCQSTFCVCVFVLKSAAAFDFMPLDFCVRMLAVVLRSQHFCETFMGQNE